MDNSLNRTNIKTLLDYFIQAGFFLDLPILLGDASG